MSDVSEILTNHILLCGDVSMWECVYVREIEKEKERERERKREKLSESVCDKCVLKHMCLFPKMTRSYALKIKMRLLTCMCIFGHTHINLQAHPYPHTSSN